MNMKTVVMHCIPQKKMLMAQNMEDGNGEVFNKGKYYVNNIS